jgi:SPOR domain
MKNFVAGVFVFCGVLVTLWAVSHYLMVGNQEQPQPPSGKLEQSEPPTAELVQPTAATPPASDDLSALSQESTVTATAPVAPEIDSEQPAIPPEPLPTPAHTDQTSDDIPASPSIDNTPPPRGWGLLTDTGETEENRLDNPNATMVRATVISKKTKPVMPKIPTQAVTTVTPRETPRFATGDLPFSLLLETYDNPENARKGVALYEQKGIAAYVAKVDLGSVGMKYRLFGGTFATEKAAQDAIKSKSLRGKPVKHTPYTALIGVFNNHQELAGTVDTISRSGAFPYVLGPPAGPFHLVVGAFYTPGGAEAQCRELIVAKLNCTVIKRSLSEKR